MGFQIHPWFQQGFRQYESTTSRSLDFYQNSQDGRDAHSIYPRKTSEPLIHVDSIFLKNFLSDDANFAHVCLCLFIKILYGLKPFLNLWLARRTSPCKFCVNTFIDRQLKTIQSIKHEGKLSSSSISDDRSLICHLARPLL